MDPTTLYIPIASPPTPSHSPPPSPSLLLLPTATAERRRFLSSVLHACTRAELLFIADSLGPLLKRDPLAALPPELALHILALLPDPRTLARAAAVSRPWRALATSDSLWRRLCVQWGFGFGVGPGTDEAQHQDEQPLEEMEPYADLPMDPALQWFAARKRSERAAASLSLPTSAPPSTSLPPQSYQALFRHSYIKLLNWEHGGRLLRAHRLPMLSASAQLPASLVPPPGLPTLHTPSLAHHHTQQHHHQQHTQQQQQQQTENGVVTCLALDGEWVVVGLAGSRIHVFSARTGVLARTLVGHQQGVWGLCLVSASPRSRSGAKEQGKEKEREGKERERKEVDVDVDPRPPLRTRRTDAVPVQEGVDLSSLLPRSLRAAVGLESDDKGEGDGDDNEDGVGGRGVIDEDAEEHQSRPQSQSQRRHSDADGKNNDKDKEKNKKKEYRPERQSDPCYASHGWGQPNAIVISGGCDKVVRVWDVKSGYAPHFPSFPLSLPDPTNLSTSPIHTHILSLSLSLSLSYPPPLTPTPHIGPPRHCIYTLPGHTSTIRCIRALHARPLAVSGARDGTVRTWDVRSGRALRVLRGHTGSVRCVDVNGCRAATGSYDTTCRIWDLDTGECVHVLRGHYHQVYTVVFDGALVATGGLDTTVRLWDADTGQCLALLQGHTTLVCQLQLSRKHRLLATGASDGRVIMFALPPLATSSSSSAPAPLPLPLPAHPTRTPNHPTSNALLAPPSSSPSSSSHPASSASSAFPTPYTPLYRLAAHDSSITGVQFDARFLVTGGNDGRVRLWETRTGRFVRELGGAQGQGQGAEMVWKVGFAARARAGGRGWVKVKGVEGEVVDGEKEEEGEGEGEPVPDVCVVVGKRSGKTILEVWGFAGG
ncbi:hypothetical protein H0H81_000989 [Sphagnurus paluster]|uniref:F-box domain-containing protein n=1 Tax=Sphagnurus paluster TaxID=117069 RepID=A0A9P7KHQ3_9AGAR|nr:hypothetical protein H0H81_000989 [Sphagnurus paluster]